MSFSFETGRGSPVPADRPDLPETTPFTKSFQRRMRVVFLVLVAAAFWLLLFAYHRASKRSFELYVSELAAQGESIEIDDLRPKPIPNPDDNVAMAPVFAEFLARRKTDPNAGKDDPVWSKLDLGAVPGFSKYNTAERSKTGIRYLQARPLWEGFDTEDDQIAAQKVLDYAESQEVHLSAIREALVRPRADFGKAYEDLLSASFGELNQFQALSKLLHRQGRAALLKGRSDLAKANSLALLRLSRHVGAQPTLINVLVAVAIHDQVISLIHDGLAAGSWREEDLADLALELEISWLEPSLLSALRMERATSVNLWEETAKGGEKFQALFPDSWIRTLFLIPDLRKGWCYDNAEFHCRTIQEVMLEDGKGNILTEQLAPRPVLPPAPRSTGSLQDRFQAAVEMLRHGLSRSSSNSFIGIHQRVLRAKVAHDHTRLAVGLAIYHARQGSYPKTLEILSLPGNAAMPLDPFTDSPFVYRPIDDSDYLLYSVGPDGRDDGGLLRYRYEEGDWVWRLFLPEDFDPETYRRR